MGIGRKRLIIPVCANADSRWGFLNALEREIPAGETVHVVLENVATHKTPEVMRWLERHPRWTFHFMPISSSWLNAIEDFFAKLAKRQL